MRTLLQFAVLPTTVVWTLFEEPQCGRSWYA